jgi:ribose 5-phosphate isomerase B
MRVGIATDQGGFGLKEEMIVLLRSAGHEVVDFGAHDLNHNDDYADYVTPLAQAVGAGRVDRGLAICGSGVGASVCANKIRGVRAALIHDHFSAKQGVEGTASASRRVWSKHSPTSAVNARRRSKKSPKDTDFGGEDYTK